MTVLRILIILLIAWFCITALLIGGKGITPIASRIAGFVVFMGMAFLAW